MNISKILRALLLLLVLASCKENKKTEISATEKSMSDYYTETYRPQFHFTPEEKWMNDPNGMVYHKGVYHLFYQYYPDDIVWGPMHWGHATSEDLVHWQHKPIALFPDKHGLIFSGSAVVDFNNTSGFGTTDNPPLVAIFTYHLMEGEKAGRTDFQTQGIAYSLDNGATWTKYEENPVIGNPGIKDFRDPKVFWDAENDQWMMSLVAGDHLQLWASEDLKNWSKRSEFGKDKGAHGGVWECPDLFPLKVAGSEEEKWVLLISINPGAPNGGSGTQYFIGDFDGSQFTTEQTEVKWIDWGTDNYAGVTYNVLPKGFYGETYTNDPGQDRIFIGWMSNWTYARDTPTETWRSAMTVPRKLTLRKVSQGYDLFNYPIADLDTIIDAVAPSDIIIEAEKGKDFKFDQLNQAEVKFKTTKGDLSFGFQNDLKETLLLTFDTDENLFSLDRSTSGEVDFQEDFGKGIQKMPVPDLPNGEFEVRILLDASSIEVFLNKGQYVMTAQLFPRENYNTLHVENTSNVSMKLGDFAISPVNRIW